MAALRSAMGLSVVAIGATLGGCDNAAGIPANSIETRAQRIKRQEAEFNASPDIKGDALRHRLNALGIEDKWMTPVVEEHGVDVLQVRVPPVEFARLDKRALAKLNLDSRYRFEFVDPGQVHAFALYHGAELHEREKAKALKELAERGQANSFPRYREGSAIAVYASRLEAWCGYRSGEALAVIDGAWLNYRHAMVDMAVVEPYNARAVASFDCVKRVVDATDLRRHFIGNRGREGAIDY